MISILKELEMEDQDIKNILSMDIDFDSFDINDIKGTARGQKVSIARHISIYLCREITNQSFVNIAAFYNKKHTTIMFAHDKIKKEQSTNRDIANALREIRMALKVM